jgi:prepilin-type N-terminal cleavage/methylation domain-containing protein
MRFTGLKKIRKRYERAYTLTEVVVAVFVLAIMATAFYGGLGSGFSITQGSREDLRATQILMQKLEAIRLCTWSELTDCTFQESYDPISTNSQGVVFTGTISTNAASDIPDSVSYKSNMRLVTVSLFWTNYNGSRPIVHSRQMQTQVARYGLQQYLWGAMR